MYTLKKTLFGSVNSPHEEEEFYTSKDSAIAAMHYWVQEIIGDYLLEVFSPKGIRLTCRSRWT